MTSFDRNAPCPCGSGRKYKRCCLDKDQPAPPPRSRRAIERDEAFEGVLRSCAKEGLEPADIVAGVPEPLLDDDTLPFWLQFVLFSTPAGQSSLVRRYLDSPRRVAHRELLEADLAAWAAVLEVVEIRPGVGITALDLLSGETVEVADVSLSRSVPSRALVMAFLAQHAGETYVANMHPFTMPPVDGHEAVARLRKALKLVEGQWLTRDDLRSFDVKSAVAVNWSLAVVALLDRPEPNLVNADGDPLLIVTDHFTVAPGASSDLIERARAIEGAGEPEADEDEIHFTFTKPANGKGGALERTILGHLTLRGERATLETNSLARADLVKARFLYGCGDLVTLKGRETEDPRTLVEQAASDDDEPADESLPTEEALRFLASYKEKHYGDWPDHPLPALDGLTPRQAAAGPPSMRGRLDLLLKDLEHHESRLPEPERYDMSRLRRSLGMA